MDNLQNTISAFDPITLDEMGNVRLMDRVDSKYVFPIAQLLPLLHEMSSCYRLLEINNIRLHRYESLYYDTPDFRFYSKHQAGKLNRHKFRFRKYVDSGGLTYFEIKFKNNKARTIKKRVKMMEIGNKIEGDAESFLKKITPFSPEIFAPKIWVNYSRMTFVNKFSQERLTVDTNLHYVKAGAEDNPFVVRFPQMVISEVKRDKTSSASPFIRIVRSNGIREGSLSKYCFGVYNLFGDLKKNNFKPRVRFIHKMAQTNFPLLNNESSAGLTQTGT